MLEAPEEVMRVHGLSGDNLSEAGWDRFRSELVGRLEAMADGDAVVVEVTLPAAAAAPVQAERSWLSRTFRSKPAQSGQPYIQFAAMEDDWLHMEASSNQCLSPQFQLDHAAVAALDGLGWSAPTVVEPGGFTAPNYAIDQPGADAPELAALAVRTLIEVFGVTEVAALSIKAV